jgi:membrane protease YdiL (CAAX protease family)
VTARVAFEGSGEAGTASWRRGLAAIAWIVLYAVVGIAASGVLLFVMQGGRFAPALAGWDFAVQSLCLAVGFLVATWLIGVRAARQSWAELGWRRDGAGGWAGRLGRGIGIGAAMAALAVGLAVLAGARVAGESAAGYLAAAIPLGVGLLAAALFEELAFRGFPLRRLATALGRWPATGVIAVGFGAAHLGNPAVSAAGVLNVALAGVWLAVAFFGGGMTLAWGLHFGWNAGLGLVFDAPVSGWVLDVPAVAYTAGGPDWLTGGAFGPEGGLLGTAVFVLGMAAVLGRRAARPREWLHA